MAEAGERTPPSKIADRFDKIGRGTVAAISEVGLGAVLFAQSIF